MKVFFVIELITLIFITIVLGFVMAVVNNVYICTLIYLSAFGLGGIVHDWIKYNRKRFNI